MWFMKVQVKTVQVTDQESNYLDLLEVYLENTHVSISYL